MITTISQQIIFYFRLGPLLTLVRIFRLYCWKIPWQIWCIFFFFCFFIYFLFFYYHVKEQLYCKLCGNLLCIGYRSQVELEIKIVRSRNPLKQKLSRKSIWLNWIIEKQSQIILPNIGRHWLKQIPQNLREICYKFL